MDLYKKFLSKNSSNEMKGDLKISNNRELLKQDKGIILIYSNKNELIYSILLVGMKQKHTIYLVLVSC